MLHTVLILSSRLEQLEKSVSDIQNSIRPVKLPVSPEFPSTPPKSRSGGVAEPRAHPCFPLLSGLRMPSGRFLAKDEASPGGRYFGPTSLTTVMLGMSDLVITSLYKGSEDGGRVPDFFQLAWRRIETLQKDREDESLKENTLPTAPPSYLLDAMLQQYFTTINPLFPIWIEEKFTRLATTSGHCDDVDSNLAFHICANNIILMSLTPRVIQPPSEEKTQAEGKRKNTSIDSDLIQTFLANAKRAIMNLELLLSPFLINVQALLSLCLIAQEHLSTEVFSMLLNHAAQCAKSIGLHRWHCSPSHIGDEDSRESRNVSYCLYILDKAVCWATGTSPSIPRSDISILPELGPLEDESTRSLVIKLKLAEVEEDIFSQVYSSQASLKTEDQIRKSIFELYHRLQAWSIESNVGTEQAANNGNEASAVNIELSFAFISTQLLLLWPFQESSDSSFQRTEMSKRCMLSLLGLWRSASEPRHLVALARLIASYPTFYLPQICIHIMTGQGDKSDVDMLRLYVEMLQSMTASRSRGTFVRRLYELSLIMLDLVNAVQETPPGLSPTSHWQSRLAKPRCRPMSMPKDKERRAPSWPHLTPFHSPPGTDDAFTSFAGANHSTSSMLEDYSSLTGLKTPQLGDAFGDFGSASTSLGSATGAGSGAASGNTAFDPTVFDAGFAADMLSTIAGGYDLVSFE